jgi:nitroimidazol reductase NimA-like FMN-containing flavoprotein (pyridoxamine 5'-phosphate oxidase superfamily)
MVGASYHNKEFPVTDRTRVKRLPERAVYDREAAYRILDEGIVCHVGVVQDGQPFVMPTGYARAGDRLVVHGSVASRLMRALRSGAPACVTVTLTDGLVLAKSAFHSSMNYRSVVVLGRATEVTEPGEKRAVLDALVEHLLPGRTADARGASDVELRQTIVVTIPLEEVSVKERSGGPEDDEADLDLPIWAGVVPLRTVAGTPEPAEGAPAYATAYRRP